MCATRSPRTDTDSFLVQLGPDYPALFHLCTGDQPLAESLTIETIGEYVGESGAAVTDNTAIPLLRRAYDKGTRVGVPIVQVNDSVVLALASLASEQRAVVVLVGGLYLKTWRDHSRVESWTPRAIRLRQTTCSRTSSC